MLNNTVGDTVF